MIVMGLVLDLSRPTNLIKYVVPCPGQCILISVLKKRMDQIRPVKSVFTSRPDTI
jgi:hypothetical protein